MFGDGAATVFEVNAVTLRQSIVPDGLMGRFNSALHFLHSAALLAGSFLGCYLGGAIGAHSTLVIAAKRAVCSLAYSQHRAVWLGPTSNAGGESLSHGSKA